MKDDWTEVFSEFCSTYNQDDENLCLYVTEKGKCRINNNDCTEKCKDYIEDLDEAEFNINILVNLNGIKCYGYTDLITTYCCSSTPCYYVYFTQDIEGNEVDYEGYITKYDVIEIIGR